jgi:predicted methyltransferase MtxX (methanogen marker protein 4)
MRVRTETQGVGPTRSEKVIAIRTVTGSTEEVSVDASELNENGVEVDFIGQKGDQVLVELRRETRTGRWRLWVSASAIIP